MALTPTTAESLTETVTQAVSFAASANWISLHSGNPGTSGTNEITSGTGTGGRQQLSASGSGGVDTNTPTLPFVLPSSSDVRWWGMWTAQTGGTFLGGFPMIGTMKPATVISGSSSIVCPAHGLGVGTPVRLYPISGLSSSAPGSFTADTTYYVVSVPNSNTVTLSATSGGSAISATTSAGFGLAPDMSANFPAGGTLELPATSGLTYQTVS